MTKGKVLLRVFLLIVIFGPIAYVGYLNESYFLQLTSLTVSLDKPFIFSYTSPEFANAFYWAACVFVGMLVASLFAFPKRMRAKKEIKRLTATRNEQVVEIERLNVAVMDLENAAEVRTTYETETKPETTTQVVSEPQVTPSENLALNDS